MKLNIKNIFQFSLFSLALVIGGCGSGSDDPTVVDGEGACGIVGAKLKPRIFNGTTCSQSARTPVVYVVIGDASGRPIAECTGTFISVTSVLTSAHCLEQAQTISIVVGGRETIPVTGVAAHPLYDGNAGSPFDVGILRISQQPSPAVGPVPILVSQLTTPGQEMTAFGYGLTQDGDSGDLKALNVRIADIVGGNLIVEVTDNDGSICPGDSGGPVIQVIDDTPTLVGVNSFVNEGACESNAASFSGFVDIQNQQTLDFIAAFVPDASYK